MKTIYRLFAVLCYVTVIILKGTGYTWYISAIFDKGDNFCDFLFAFLHTSPLIKRVQL